MTSAQIDEQLISEILPGLFMGGTDDYDTTRFPKTLPSLATVPEYDSVATMYAYAHPMGWHVSEWRYGLPDGPLSAVSEHQVTRMADWLYGEWQAGKAVLSRCQQGWNRSGLVVALVLLRAGYTPAEAIRLIREKRSPHALCNADFVDFIHEAGAQTDASGAFFASRVPIEDFLAPPQADGMPTASRAFEGVTSIP